MEHGKVTFETEKDSVAGHLYPSDLARALHSVGAASPRSGSFDLAEDEIDERVRFRARSLPPETILAMEMARGDLERRRLDGGSEADEVDHESSYHDPEEEHDMEDFYETEIKQNEELLRPTGSVNELRKGGSPGRKAFRDESRQDRQQVDQYDRPYRQDTVSHVDALSHVAGKTEADHTLPDPLESSILSDPSAKQAESGSIKLQRWSLWEMLMEDSQDVDAADGFRIDGKWDRIANFLAVPLAIERVCSLLLTSSLGFGHSR